MQEKGYKFEIQINANNQTEIKQKANALVTIGNNLTGDELEQLANTMRNSPKVITLVRDALSNDIDFTKPMNIAKILPSILSAIKNN